MRTSLSLMFALVLAAGCDRGAEFVNATPENETLTMELTGDGADEGLAPASSDAVEGVGEAQAALSGPVPEYLGHARDGVRAVNQAIVRILTPIIEAVRDEGAQAQIGATRKFGPKDHGAATFVFYVKRIDGNTFGWRLDAKPQGAADSAYVQVMGGLYTVGLLPHRGRGVMGADLDKLATVDSQFHGAGQMLVGFAHVGGYKILAYGLKGFSPDVTTFDPVDAVFAGWRGPAGVTRVRVAAYANVADSPTAAKELTFLRARWLPGVGGRADARIRGGDVPAGRVLIVNSCWSRDLTDVDGFLLVRDCEAGHLIPQGCTVVRTAGVPANCARDLATEELPPEDPTSPDPEAGAPESITPPSTMP